eukprot:2340889-Amphidinium_carterae.1
MKQLHAMGEVASVQSNPRAGIATLASSSTLGVQAGMFWIQATRQVLRRRMNGMEQTLKKQIADVKEDPTLQKHLQAALASVQSTKREALPLKDQKSQLLGHACTCGRDGPKNEAHASSSAGSRCFARKVFPSPVIVLNLARIEGKPILELAKRP